MNNQEMQTVLKLIGLKQEESLLKWLFMPFWKALTATIILITFCFIFNGTFFMAIILSPVIAFGIYMSRRCYNRLKELKEFDINPRYMK
ncbi:unnamed protein product [marine sediment metagenome]|uniref:Uncharacterized protein n=1 Tax=marine sediment metagenome TaxID=412755 RepID=X1GIZ9_9ZZZZ